MHRKARSRRGLVAALIALAVLAGAFLFVAAPSPQPAAEGTPLSVVQECQAALGYPARTSADKTWLRQCVHALSMPSPTGTPTPLPPKPTPTTSPTGAPTPTPTVSTSPTGSPTPSPTSTGTPPPANGQFTPAYYGRWSNGPTTSTAFFPISVWDQNPERSRTGWAPGMARPDDTSAARFGALGVNTFLGNYGAPDKSTEMRLEFLASHGEQGFYDVGSPADVAFYTAMSATAKSAHTANLLGDEQDMADGASIQAFDALAASVQAADPTRPTVDNFGKCFSLEPWGGCQDLVTRAGFPNTEAGFAAALTLMCSHVDIASSDYYAATDGWEPDAKHTPNYYGAAVAHTLALCGGGTRPVYGFVETGHPGGDREQVWPGYSDAAGNILPSTVVAAVWSELANGADGINLFVHDFYATGGNTEDGLFDHPDTVAAVAGLVGQIEGMAPILNAQRQLTGLTVTGVDATLRRNAQGSYVIAASTSPGVSTVGITVAGWAGKTVTVVGEGRTVTADASGHFSDSTAAWGHHVYAVTA